MKIQPNKTQIETLMRPPEQVMRLNRMGSLHQSRLSFMRSLLRLMKRENWVFSRPVWRMNDFGMGVAVYQATGPARSYSLICFSHEIDPAKRTDRSIATEWDATFTMFDGIPTEDDLERLKLNVPKQEAGRVSESELSISRANKSVRLFEHVVERLAAGQQPDVKQIEDIGYLMRTTAVYGSGKFGAASRDKLKSRPEVSRPFHMEMMSVYLTRAFTADLVEHIAAKRGGKTATTIDANIRRRLGVGNSTGLGMAPFLVNHPTLTHNWINARETALARVRSITAAEQSTITSFLEGILDATESIGNWKTTDDVQTARIGELIQDMGKLNEYIGAFDFSQSSPWDALYRWGEDNLELEAQELLVSSLIEPFGDLVDDLLDTMSADEEAEFRIDGTMSVGDFRKMIETRYGWALATDFQTRDNCARFWYVSSNKAEPRLGERFEEEDSEQFEEPLDVGRDVSNFYEALAAKDSADNIAEFLMENPHYRKIVRRLQVVSRFPYGEICDNLISSAVRPIDMLRCKLSFFGAVDFDPRSDRWVRITMFKNAPFPHELDGDSRDNWAYSSVKVGQ
ncbi:hypothetical protein RB2150_17942 [Rhodobacterales bacterium HTCC2150]|nr:hypothetical protein RB2150_17942 [Rhodobacterales bacterium HTCC2150] [Rhodobacteraceae bacterium HTCC2150]